MHFFIFFTLRRFQADGDIFLHYTSNFSKELTTPVESQTNYSGLGCAIFSQKNIPEIS